MPGLVPGTHVFLPQLDRFKTWMAGPSPATGGFWLGIPNNIPAEAALAREPDSDGLDPAIPEQPVDARNKSGHDGLRAF